MAQLNWTDEAEFWLRDIYDCIAADNENAAASVVEGIFQRAQLLTEFPEIGYGYEGSSRAVRILLYGHYRIAYLVKLDWGLTRKNVFFPLAFLAMHLRP